MNVFSLWISFLNRFVCSFPLKRWFVDIMGRRNEGVWWITSWCRLGRECWHVDVAVIVFILSTILSLLLSSPFWPKGWSKRWLHSKILTYFKGEHMKSINILLLPSLASANFVPMCKNELKIIYKCFDFDRISQRDIFMSHGMLRKAYKKPLNVLLDVNIHYRWLIIQWQAGRILNDCDKSTISFTNIVIQVWILQ